ncbi:MAG TPA: adenylate/guanylate cyclase domain-containing protein [Acidimicrobiia bacterium]|nr:adenylate/guanylate cyclase domain-containing protein [Acidimicrobiia bacterium]
MARSRHSVWFKPLIAAVIAVVITVVAAAGLSANAFTGNQRRLADALYPGTVADSRIIVVAIDDVSIVEVGRWPWNRSVHARLIDAMVADGARLIGYDVTFATPSRLEPEADADFAASIAQAGNVVLGEDIIPVGGSDPPRVGEVFEPIPMLRDAAAAVGHTHVWPDTDGVHRAMAPVLETDDGALIPSLSFAMAQLATGHTGPVTIRPDGVQVGGLFVATGTDGPHLLDVNFAAEQADAGGFQVVRALDVLRGELPDGTFEGRFVLVGATAPGLQDIVSTPIDRGSGQPGVLVHANALNTMLRGDFITLDGEPMVLIWVLLLALLVALATMYWRPWLAVAVAAGGFVSYFAVVFARFDGSTVWRTVYPPFSVVTATLLGVLVLSLVAIAITQYRRPGLLAGASAAVIAGYAIFLFVPDFTGGTVMNMVYPPAAIPVSFVAALGVRYFTEVRERKYVTNVFGRYLAKDVVNEVLTSPEGAVATLSGASRPLAVLFADLRGFTAASEHAAPTAVVNALNEYLEAMTRAVVEEQGTVDKFMGDCVMAFWGAPRVDPDMVVRSVRAGLKMLDYVDEAITHGSAGELKVKGVGVGLSFGEAVVGNIGSNERLDYTAIGDTVNTASRVCGVAGGGEIVVTEEFAEALPRDEFRLAPLPPLKVKGKTELLRVMQVLREGQEAKVFEEGAFTDASEEKGAFQPPDWGKGEEKSLEAPPKVAGYAPVEPRDEGAEESVEAGTE